MSGNRKIFADRAVSAAFAVSAGFAASATFASFAAVASTGCRSQPAPAREVSVWRQVGSWHGRGNMQTETFTGDSGAFRVTWETSNETAPGAGRLSAVFRSGDSGREIMDAVKAEGVGHGVEHVSAERPRWYYLTIESANVEWAITVDEQIPGQVPGR